jgi:amidase
VDEIIYSSATKLAQAIRAKTVSSAEVVEAYLQRIETVNPKLNAVVLLTADAARQEARNADKALAEGIVRGPLHGVPITLKDNLDTAGVITTGGTQGRANFIPEQDATVVARLRAAGAILLGKTNTPELTLAFETDNLLHGRTNNPYNLDRTSGGSSGGAAAILAAGGSPLDIGSDTAGSIRLPAHCCGIAGIRPTSGRVPRTGHILPPAGMLDSLTQIGPMARFVEDLALTLPIISGVDWRDPAIVPMPLGDPQAVQQAGLRVATYTDNGLLPPTTEVADVVNRATKALADGGMQVTEARPTDIEQTAELFFDLNGADGSAGLRMLLQRYGTTKLHPWMQSVLRSDEDAPSGEEVGAVLFEWDIFRSRMLTFMENYDVILCPVCAFPALPHGTWFDDDKFLGFMYTTTYNLTGWPAASVRCGTTADGLPIGVQVVGRPWREDVVLAVAAYLEEVFGGWQPPPM